MPTQPASNVQENSRRKTNAEYQREYRARKNNSAQVVKEEPQPSTSSVAYLNTNRLTMPMPTQTASNVQGKRRRKTNAEYQREYRARKNNSAQVVKEEPQPSTSSATYLNTNRLTMPTQTALNVQEKRRRKTNAEYQREYRARKNHSTQVVKEEPQPSTSSVAYLNTNRLTMPTQTTINVQKKGRRKTNAEYQREYRARKKHCAQVVKEEPQQSTSSAAYLHIDRLTMSTKTAMNVKEKGRRKTNAENQRNYRARKKDHAPVAQQEDQSLTPTVTLLEVPPVRLRVRCLRSLLASK